jgi:hypothetical protein
MIGHPLEAIPAGKRPWVLLGLLAAAVLLMTVTGITGARLTTPSAPQGIVSFELAGSLPEAQRILDSWDAAARLRAAFGLGLDFLFPLVYSTAIALGCVWASGTFRTASPGLAVGGVLLAWEQWLAALFDYLENISLTAILFGGAVAPLPELARAFALVKFCLIGVGLAYVVLGLSVRTVGLLMPRRG